MDRICDITAPSGVTYVDKLSIAHPPIPFKSARSILHFCRKNPARTI